jgi:3-oxoadipate enol-lactonase
VLLLPGQSNSHHWWDGLRETFGDQLQTVTFDYRGTGSTTSKEDMAPGYARGWSTSSFADDALTVLDALGHDRFHVYGTSMGGRVAQMLALAAPDRVERLVMACTSPGGRHALERSQDVRRVLSQPDRRARQRALFELFYTATWTGRPEDSNLLGDPTMTHEALRAHLRVSARHDAWDRLGRITTPTLLLHGTDDLMVPVDNARLIARRLPDVTVHIHEGGRHGFFEEFADELTPRIVGFLTAP